VKIIKLIIQNFRCFGNIETEINFEEDLTALIGLNSSGKSATLEALRKLFGISSAERALKRSDFHVPKGKNPSEIKEANLSIEAIIEFDIYDETSIPHYFNSLVVNNVDCEPYLRIRLEAIWIQSSTPEGEIEIYVNYITVPLGEEIRDENKIKILPHQRSLIQVFYVPAIRKPSDQLRFASGSILWRLLNKIEWEEDFKEDFKIKIGEINDEFKKVDGFNKLQDALTNNWKEFHRDNRFTQSNLTFGDSSFDEILKKIEIEFLPSETGKPARIDDLGEGLRSLFYLNLVYTLLSLENEYKEAGNTDYSVPELTILAVEEPENHIAPQILGKLVAKLFKISKSDNIQVAISSHTPAIIQRVLPEAIRHLRIDYNTHSAQINSILLPDKKDEAYKFIKEAVLNFPEIYFARLVIIGEGDSEEVLFNRLSRVYTKSFDDSIITFVPLGHRFVNHIWKLLENLNIPYITLLDLDREREGGGWGRIKYAINQLIDIGVEKNKLLEIEGGKILPDEEFKAMHTWDVEEIDLINSWVSSIEPYNVFFSSPLDLDFMLLTAYKSQYISTIPKGFGPRIPDKIKEKSKFDEKVKIAIQATLKSEEKDGTTYSEQEKELMIYYNYFFLGSRGKPATHILALSGMTNEELKKNLPPVLFRLFKKMKELLSSDPFTA